MLFSVLLQRLLQLSAADIYRFAENKQDADLLLEAIQSLRETGVGSAPTCTSSECMLHGCKHGMISFKERLYRWIVWVVIWRAAFSVYG